MLTFLFVQNIFKMCGSILTFQHLFSHHIFMGTQLAFQVSRMLFLKAQAFPKLQAPDLQTSYTCTVCC